MASVSDQSTIFYQNMPRRPRPALRGRPKEEGPVVNVASSSKAKLSLAKIASKRNMEAVDSEPDLDEEEREDNDSDEGPSSESDEEDSDLPGNLAEDEESDVNMDAPRVAQWVDEEDLERAEAVSGDASHKNAVDPEDIVRFYYLPLRYERFVIYCFPPTHRKPSKIVRQITTWRRCASHYTPLPDLASLPLGALRRAQRALARAQAEENPSDSEEDESSESESGPEQVSVKGKGSRPNAHKPEWSNKPRTDISKRSNKNA